MSAVPGLCDREAEDEEAEAEPLLSSRIGRELGRVTAAVLIYDFMRIGGRYGSQETRPVPGLVWASNIFVNLLPNTGINRLHIINIRNELLIQLIFAYFRMTANVGGQHEERDNRKTRIDPEDTA